VDNSDKEALLRVRPWAPDREDEKRQQDASPEVYQQQKEFNARVHDELAAIPVPTALRDQILARRKILRISQWHRATPVLAMAAALVFLAAGLFYWMRPQQNSTEDLTIAGFRSRMVAFAVREYRMDWFTKDLGVLKQNLAQKGGPAQFTLPPRLASMPLKGGAGLRWQGKRVSMVCFNWTPTETLYMFVLNEELADPSPLQPPFVKKLNTVTWKADGKTFLLAGRIPEDRLMELVKS
jgi:hypothetical protein